MTGYPQSDRFGAAGRRRPAPAGAVLLALLSLPLGGQAEPPAAPPFLAAQTVSQAGPLEIGGARFTVRVTTDRSLSARYLAFPTTVRRCEILDASGAVVFSENFPGEAREAGFFPSITLDVYRLKGADRDGIVFFRETAPAAPMSGRSFRVFGRRGGRLEPISPWITVYGTIRALPSAGARTLRLVTGDIIEVSVWTGWYGVVVPVNVDLARDAVTVPAGTRTYAVQTGAPRLDKDAGEVRLFASPSADAGFARVPITRKTRIEYLDARAAASLAGEGSWREVALDEMPWLRVRVDGREGWIRESEDLIAAGLRQAG